MLNTSLADTDEQLGQCVAKKVIQLQRDIGRA